MSKIGVVVHMKNYTLVNNNTRINSVFHILTTVNLLFPTIVYSQVSLEYEEYKCISEKRSNKDGARQETHTHTHPNPGRVFEEKLILDVLSFLFF